MPKQITDLTVATPADDDQLLFRDVSDLTDGAGGTDKRGSYSSVRDGNIITDLADLRDVTPVGGRVVYVVSHTRPAIPFTGSDGGGGEFEALTGAAAGTYTDDDGVTIVPTGGDGSACWRRRYSGAVHVAWYNAIGSGDESTKIQAAITEARGSGAGKIELAHDKTYACNITIGFCDIIGNRSELRPATNNPVIEIDGSFVTLTAIKMILTTIDRAWTNADAVRIYGGAAYSGSLDSIVIDKCDFRRGPAFGIIAAVDSTTSSIQRVTIKDSKATGFEYAGLRAEGQCLEWRVTRNVFTGSNKSGTSTVRTSAVSGRTQTPDRTFHRGTVELLRWHDGTDANNSTLPGRIYFSNNNITPDEPIGVGLTYDYRSSGLYIEGGRGITIDTNDFENPNPAIELLKHPDSNTINGWTGVDTINITGNTFAIVSSETNAVIELQYCTGIAIENNRLGGGTASGAEPYAFVLCTEAGSSSKTNFRLVNNVNKHALRTLTGYVGTTVKFADPTGGSGLYVGSRTYTLTGYDAYRWINATSTGGIGFLYDTTARTIDAMQLGSTTPEIVVFTDGVEHALRRYPGSASMRLANDAHREIAGVAQPDVIPGRFMLAGGMDALLDSDDKQINFRFDSVQDAWVETSRNFDVSLTGSATWDPASLADGAGETSSSITVTGAAVGDFVVASAPYDLQGITCNAYVDAADSVKIRIQNETGGAIDLASGTWRVKVFKL